ncbi:MAG: ATP-binding protein [Deltaproteobacteria bacterium]|jgi:hypothetical protein|nr:ATP-binding protein [Deltaproteobacteria bacterium]
MKEIVRELPADSPPFAEIIQNNMVYVDKTAYLGDMIANEPSTLFFTRPRRFGKSLTLSTLEALLRGQKELFKGLAIYNRLEEEVFAPRPVIHLNMRKTSTNAGVTGFRDTLGRMTTEVAENLRVTVPHNLLPSEILSTIIERCAKKSPDTLPAVLIDEYDSPYLNLRRKPDQLEEVKEILSDYYVQLKNYRDKLSFVFVTGITKSALTEFNSTLNNSTDISIEPKYGALTGFTHEEIKANFGPHIREAAISLNLTEAKLLDELRDYYYGFCFDGQTYLYNPFAIMRFFLAKKFRNFWFSSGPSYHLAQYLKNKRLIPEDLRGIPISQSEALNLEDSDDPTNFLYQAGYLSLRPGDDDKFTLDFPNREVLKSISLLAIKNFFSQKRILFDSFNYLEKALSHRDPTGVINEFNLLLSNIPYNDFESVRRTPNGLYRACLLTYLYSAGLHPVAERPGNFGRTDIAFKYKNAPWVMEFKVCDGDQDEATAGKALERILATKYGDSFRNPVLLGIAINNQDRTIKAWQSRDDSRDES